MSEIKINFPTFSEEEIEKSKRNFYSQDRSYPENFSNWYPHILDFGNFRHANIVSNQIFTYEQNQQWETTDNIDNVKNWDDLTDILKPTIDKMKPNTLYNIKTGCFSNKFDFQTSIVTKKNIAEQFWKIRYSSLLYGCDFGTSEIVVRDLIPYKYTVTPTIYNGLPLREEVRVFYNMNTHNIEYMVDYWDYNYCIDKIYNMSDIIIFKWFHNKLKTRKVQHTKRLKSLKQLISENINTLKFDNWFEGIWSIDFMYVDDMDKYMGIWLIDMARGERSTYWDETKINNKEVLNKCKNKI